MLNLLKMAVSSLFLAGSLAIGSSAHAQHAPTAPTTSEQKRLGLQLAHTVLRGLQWTEFNVGTPGCLVADELPNVSPHLERNDETYESLEQWRRRFLIVDSFRVIPLRGTSRHNPYAYNSAEDTFLFRFAVSAKKGRVQGFVQCLVSKPCRIVRRGKKQIFTLKVGLANPTAEQEQRIGRVQSQGNRWAVPKVMAMMMNSDVVETLRVVPRKCTTRP